MGLKAFLKKIFETLRILFEGLGQGAREAIHVGILITEQFKAFVDSPVADILTALIPGDLDDRIKDILQAQLPEIVIKLRLADANGTTDEIIKQAIETLSRIEGSFRKDFLDALAVEIALVSSDGKITWSEAKYVLKWYYDNVIKDDG
jgi:hypothetical protein